MTFARAGAEEELLVAGLLHDLAEDTPADLGEIEDLCGDRVVTTAARCPG
jgi:(p)ppGpp synthase/HD superfamily hydrolase